MKASPTSPTLPTSGCPPRLPDQARTAPKVARLHQALGHDPGGRPDNGSESVSRDLDLRACRYGVTLDSRGLESQRTTRSSKRSIRSSARSAYRRIGFRTLRMRAKRWGLGAGSPMRIGPQRDRLQRPHRACQTRRRTRRAAVTRPGNSSSGWLKVRAQISEKISRKNLTSFGRTGNRAIIFYR